MTRDRAKNLNLQFNFYIKYLKLYFILGEVDLF